LIPMQRRHPQSQGFVEARFLSALEAMSTGNIVKNFQCRSTYKILQETYRILQEVLEDTEQSATGLVVAI